MPINEKIDLSKQERLNPHSSRERSKNSALLERTGITFAETEATQRNKKPRPANRLMSDMPPDLLGFMQAHLDSFAKWDLIHFFHRNPQTIDTAENIARYIGRDRESIQAELSELAIQGILAENHLNNKSVYSLSRNSDVNDLLHRFVIHCNDRQFRVKAVYQIIQAMR